MNNDPRMSAIMEAIQKSGCLWPTCPCARRDYKDGEVEAKDHPIKKGK